MADVAPAASSHSTWARLPGRGVLLARGPDAVRFVDNFTTAAVSRLPVGAGTEGFFCDARGHVLALANILRTETGLWIDTAAGLAEPLRSHLDHYLIREQVDLTDASADHAAFLVTGPEAAARLAGTVPGDVPTARLAHDVVRVAAADDVRIVALDWFGPGGLLLVAPTAAATRCAAWLAATGLAELDAGGVDTARIEAGTPGPADIDAKTLPQELGRDARAICLTKGCYLGQETVARIDALGHVNRRLVTLAAAEALPADGVVTADGAAVGIITSTCISPRLGGGLGLALLHVRALAGVPLDVEGRPVRVVRPPAAAEET